MAIPSNGITAEVIRDIMPPYQLSTDLLEGTFAALPPPPADASPAWRQRHIARLTAEITTLKPADAGQARMAAGILILRELADTQISRAYAEGVTIEQMCRLGRTAAELVRTAGLMGRALERSQQMPVPFYGTVVEDEVDLVAVDRAWGGRGMQQPDGGTPSDGEAAEAADGPGGPKDGPVPRGMAGSTPGTSVPPGQPPGQAPGGKARRWQAPVGQGLPAMTTGEMGEGGGDGGGDDGDSVQRPVADAEASVAVTPMPLPADQKVWAQPRRSPDTAARPGRDAGAAPEWTTTRLDQGPGWTLEVVRPRASGKAGAGAGPRSVA